MESRISTFIVNLRKRPERKEHSLSQFRDREEFQVRVVEAFEDPEGARGLWRTLQYILRELTNETDEYVLLCEDDHQFTESYSSSLLQDCIGAANELGADVLTGGVSWMDSAVRVSDNLYWTDRFTGLQFVILYRRFFDRILQSDLPAGVPADYRLSDLSGRKFILSPFVSVQKEFGYSDVTSRNNETGRVSALFERSMEQLGLIRKIAGHYSRMRGLYRGQKAEEKIIEGETSEERRGEGETIDGKMTGERRGEGKMIDGKMIEERMSEGEMIEERSIEGKMTEERPIEGMATEEQMTDEVKEPDVQICIPVYYILSEGEEEAPSRLKEEFRNRPEFDLRIASLGGGAVDDAGRARVLREIAHSARRNEDDVIGICTGGLQFTEQYSKKELFRHIIQAGSMGTEILCGGVEGFEMAVPLTTEKIWVGSFSGSPLIFLLSPVFDKMLTEELPRGEGSCYLSTLSSRKMVLAPFISVEDSSTGSNIKGARKKDSYMTSAARLASILQAAVRYGEIPDSPKQAYAIGQAIG